MSTWLEYRVIVFQEESQYGPYTFTGLTYQAAEIMKKQNPADLVPLWKASGTWRVKVEARSVDSWMPYEFV